MASEASEPCSAAFSLAALSSTPAIREVGKK